MTRKRHTDARNPSPESALARQEYVGAVPGPDDRPSPTSRPSMATARRRYKPSRRRRTGRGCARSTGAALKPPASARSSWRRPRRWEFDHRSIKVAQAAQGRLARFWSRKGRPRWTPTAVLVPGRGLRPSDVRDIAQALRTLQQVVHAAAGAQRPRCCEVRPADPCRSDRPIHFSLKCALERPCGRFRFGDGARFAPRRQSPSVRAHFRRPSASRPIDVRQERTAYGLTRALLALSRGLSHGGRTPPFPCPAPV